MSPKIFSEIKPACLIAVTRMLCPILRILLARPQFVIPAPKLDAEGVVDPRDNLAMCVLFIGEDVTWQYKTAVSL